MVAAFLIAAPPIGGGHSGTIGDVSSTWRTGLSASDSRALRPSPEARGPEVVDAARGGRRSAGQVSAGPLRREALRGGDEPVPRRGGLVVSEFGVDFGLKPTVRVNHVTIHPLAPGTPTGVAYVIAIKQLYASHYFHTTLELRFLADGDGRSGEPRMSLVSITRSRSDGMTGFKGLFLRPVISRRSREAVRGYLEHVKQQVERPAGAL